MVFYAHLSSAKQIIAEYKGQQSFSVYLKSFFKQHKKYGSKDRKNISQLCFSYFRIGRALPGLDTEERIKVALFLCANKRNELLEFLPQEWAEFLEKNNFPDISDRTLIIKDTYPGFHQNDIYPCPEELSGQINKEAFILSHLQQPDLFIRIRPGYQLKTLNRLKEQGAPFEFIEPFTVRLSNAFPLDSIALIDKEIVVQDLSSQKTGGLLKIINKEPASPLEVWDCCAASGGKSILAYDILGKIELTVSDIRKDILLQLSKRFSAAGIKGYRSFIKDLSAPSLNNVFPQDKVATGIKPGAYDLIIVDAPCSGSGTWSRNPEHLSFFNKKDIDRYVKLQQQIVNGALPFLKNGGYLLYITCSAFRRENEEIANIIREKAGMELLEMQLIEGYAMKADTMFAALFRALAIPA